jgi:hypothetical protein
MSRGEKQKAIKNQRDEGPQACAVSAETCRKGEGYGTRPDDIQTSDAAPHQPENEPSQ